MNIVHVVRQFFPAVGGFESVVLELAAAQVTAGHRVRIITLDRLFNANRVLLARDIVCGAEVIRIPYFGSQRYPLAPSVINFIRDADIVHVHAIDFFFDYLAWTKPLHRKRLVVSTHGGFFHTSYAARLKKIYFATITRLSLACYDSVIAVSAADREVFSKIRKGVVCIENGVNVSKYSNSSSAVPAHTLLALGRLSSNKRLDRLISFVAALRKHDSRWTMIIAGRQWDVGVDEIKVLAEKQGVLDAIEIVVEPNDNEIRNLMGRCSAIVSASDYEGFGVAAIEGMSAGLFPVLSEIPTFRELVARTGVGTVVAFSNPDAAAEAFTNRWKEVRANYPRDRTAAINAALGYAWPKVSQAYEEVYKGICGITKRTILGVPIFVGAAPQAVEMLDNQFEYNEPAVVAFANAHTLNVATRDHNFRRVLRNSIVLNDGIGVDIASLILFGLTFPQNLNGTDFIPHYLQKTRHQFRIFLLGGRVGVAERAGLCLSRRFPQHRIVGWHPGYFAEGNSGKIAEMIKASKCDIILVAMGNPLQELWLARNLELTGIRLGFAVGALFDFVAGEVSRAPAWVRHLRLEWVFRLMQEPVRLAQRYLIGNPRFILRIVGQRISRVPISPLLDQ
jgi:alpha-1,3-mannosyltransferase